MYDYRNFSKRLIKAPKLYFLDVGLAAWMLGIHTPEKIQFHAQRGALFESFVITEFLKNCFNRGLTSNLYYWRDSKGLEVSRNQIRADHCRGFLFFIKELGQACRAGEPAGMARLWRRQALTNRNISIVPWRDIPLLIEDSVISIG
jgi:hypothetical protein